MQHKFKLLCAILSLVLLLTSLIGCSRSSINDVTIPSEEEPVRLLYSTYAEYVSNSKHLHPEKDEYLRYAVYDKFAQVIECVSDATDIVIPDEYNGVPVIGIRASAFANNTTMQHLTIGHNILQIGESAFINCTALTQVKMSNSVNEIGPTAFSGCVALTNIVVPPQVAMIYSNTFAGCRSLRKVVVESAEMTVPTDGRESTVAGRTIESGAFSNCDRLAIMWIPEDINSVANSILGGSTPKPLICGGDATASSWFATLQCLDYELVDRDDFNAHARIYQESLTVDKTSEGEFIKCGTFDIMLDSVEYYNKIGNLVAGSNHILVAAKVRIYNPTMVSQYFDGLNVTCTSTAPDKNGIVSDFVKYPLMLSSDVLDVSYPVGNIYPDSYIEGVIILRVSERYESIQILFNGAEAPLVI